MKLFDLHNDFPTKTMSRADRKAGYADFQSEAARVVSVFFTTRTQNPFSFIAEYIQDYQDAAAHTFAVEDLWFVKTAADIEKLLQLPILYAGLTWNGANGIAGGTGSHDTLSPFGRQVVDALAKSRIKIDTAHLNETSFYAVVDQAEVIINSHTCLKRICPHERNLSDEQIKLILSRGGVVGITGVAQFMGKSEGQGTRADFVRQLDTFAQAFGIDGLAIGTDFNGTDPIQGLENYRDFDALGYDLQKLGYQKADIERIFFRNASALFGSVLP